MSNVQNKIIKLLFSTFFIFAELTILASGNIDSLYFKFKRLPSDSSKIELTKKVIFQTENISVDNSFLFIDKTISFSDSIYNENLKFELLKLKASLLSRNGKYQKAIILFQKVLENSFKKKDSVSIAGNYTNLAKVYYKQNRLDEYLSYNLKAIEVTKNKTWNKKGDAYSNIATYYFDKPELSDSTEKYFQLAIEEYKKYNQKKRLVVVYTNMGTYYFYKNTPEGYVKALEYYEQTRLAYSKENDIEKEATSILNIGYVYFELNEYTKAIEYATKASQMFSDIEDRLSVSECMDLLTQVYRNMGEFEKAYEILDSLREIEMELRGIETQKAIVEMETKFNTKQKEKENQLLKSENKLQHTEIQNQRIIGYSLGGGVILLFVISGLIYIQFRNKKKANKLLTDKNDEILAQSEEISSQRDKLENQNHILSEQKQEITDSINYAKRIQGTMLKINEKVTKNTPPFFIYFQPKDIVSGDFYWVAEKGGYIYITAADCTGHGVPGAFMSMLGISFLNAILKSNDLITPAEILDKLKNHVIVELDQGVDGESKDGMDMGLIRYHKETSELLFAGANNGMYIVTNDLEKVQNAKKTVEIEGIQNTLVEIAPNKQPIGFREKTVNFDNVTLNIKKGESIYLFSDGFPDQFGGEKSKKFGYKNFKKELLKNHHKTVLEQKENLNSIYNNWINSSDEEQIDDVCVIGIKF